VDALPDLLGRDSLAANVDPYAFLPMASIHLSSVDWIVLCSYLVIVLSIGFIASRKVKGTAHYFLGNRRFGKTVMIAQSFGTGTHAEMPVSLAGAVYSMGVSGMWYQWKNLFVTPFYWLLAPLFRRFRRATMSEVVEDRYGRWMAAFYTAYSISSLSIDVGSMLKGAAKVIDQATGGAMPLNGVLVGMAAIFIIYSFVGGIMASAWSDVMQGMMIIVLSFIVIPLGWSLAGGMAGMKETLGVAKFSLIAPNGIGPWFIFVLTLNGLIGIVAQPHLIAAVGTGEDEYTCRVGQFYGTLIKRICTVGWAVVGLLTATLIARGTFGIKSLSDPEEAFGFACRHLLFPGGIGLLIACFLAANMAGCSAFMVDAGAIVTNGLYRKYIAPRRSDYHYLWVGRISGLLVTLVAVVYAVFFIERVLYSFLLTETMSAFVGVSILGGIIWPRANRWGAIASIVAAVLADLLQYQHLHQRLDYWDPNVFGASLIIGVIALVVVSLVTPSEPVSASREFREKLQRPSAGDDDSNVESDAARTGEQLLIVNALSLRKGAGGYGFFHAYRTDLLGFAKGAGLVTLLIGIAIWIFR